MTRTPKARALGAALRSAREDRGVRLRDLADRISRNAGVLSRYETGDRTPKPEHVSQILTALGVIGEQFDEIMSLAYDTDAPLWVAATLPAQRQQLAAFVDAEQHATEIVSVSPLLVPGLLQTDGYITAIMTGGGVPADEVVTRTAIRRSLRDIVTRGQPVRYTVFVGEAALHQAIGGPAVMADQLRALLERARRPNIRLRVVPFDSGWHPALEGAFTIIDPGNPVALVHIENRKSGLFLHEEDDVRAYLDAVDMVRAAAKDEKESAALMIERLKGWEKVS